MSSTLFSTLNFIITQSNGLFTGAIILIQFRLFVFTCKVDGDKSRFESRLNLDSRLSTSRGGFKMNSIEIITVAMETKSLHY